jgi:hypothetical protein
MARGAPVLADRLDHWLFRHGAKPACLLHGTERELDEIAGWSSRRGWDVAWSSIEFELPDGGFSDVMHRPRAARPGSGAWTAIAIANSGVVADALVRAYDGGDDPVVGALLGYPACCIDAFGTVWPIARRQHHGDVAKALLARADPIVTTAPWALNVFVRQGGAEVVQHFPCRPDCEVSIEVARRHLAVMRASAPTRVSEAERSMRATVTWGPGGLSVIPTASRRAEPGAATSVIHFDEEVDR